MPVVIRDGSKPGFDADGPLVTYLNRYHRKRENIRFLAVCPLIVPDLWRNPSFIIITLSWSDPCRISVLSDHGKTNVCDSRVVHRIHEDAWLIGCKFVVK